MELHFFSEENRWGYVYRGENKHFNYLSNCPIPVLVLLCNPEKKEVFWECFDPIKIERTKKSWKINIPKRQLIDSRDEILALLPEEVDYYSEFEMFWCVNKIFNENIDITRLIIHKEDVLRFDFDFVISVFKRLKVTKEFAYSQQGKVEILFGGYDDDPRELLEIPEVVSYAKQLGKIIPDLFFFCDMSSTMSSFLILGWCNGEPKVIADTNTQVSIDYNKMREFIDYQSSGLKSITAWLNMSENEYETILNKAIKRLYYNYY